MKSIRIFLLTWAFTTLAAFGAAAQTTFVGTNAPGTGTNYTFNIPAGVTNLSLLVSNSSTTYANLLLTPGGTPTDTSFTYISRLVGTTNQIDLELPECVTGTYGLRVSTPAGSTTDPFSVALTTNRPDIRSAKYPALKPLVFSTTGSITNTSGSAMWNYFQVDVPSNLLTGWRIVLNCTNANPPGIYIKRNQLPNTGNYDQAIAPGQSLDTIIFTSAQATNSTYFIGIYSGSQATNHYILSTELASITALTWDPGAVDVGSPQTYTNASVTGGDYFFSINTQTTANQVWRTVLNVFSNQASLYLSQGSLPSTSSYQYSSTLTGSNGLVLAQSYQFQAGQTWYILVHAQPNAQWTLLTGQAYVQPLPALAADSSSGATATIGGEGIRFFSTTISSNTLAWRLWLNGLTNQMYVKETAAPLPLGTGTYDLTQPGQMLVVPTYLNVGSQYFVSVVGSPGLTVPLDSRQQGVTNLAFGATTNLTVTGYGYTTFLVQVPIQQIAWQINVTPSSGNANVAVRQNNVPNEFVNDAFSEPPPGVGASVTLVPSTLSNGTFYITVYGSTPYSITLTNGQPNITAVDYVFQVTNDAPNRVGWRYYQVTNTTEQLGSLGWELDLSNQVPGTMIAIRRNAVPGQWNYRNNPYDYYGSSTLGYMDLSTTYGFLQQPNHPSDIWYIGIYTPATALGSFVLTGSQLIGAPVSFDGSGNTLSVTNQPSQKFQYFVFNVPSGVLGWDLRLTNVTSGDPEMYICRDELPPGNGNGWSPSYNSSWPSGYNWGIGYDWTDYYYNYNGSISYGQVFEDGIGNPLTAGTYYVAVGEYTGSANMSYSIESQGIGTGYSIPVTPLTFSNGMANVSSLNPRQAAYYSMTVPTNATSWQVELDTNVGQSILLIQNGALPDSDSYNNPAWDLSGGRVMAKAGDQQYLMMPYTSSNPSNIVGGTYYLAVVSEGQNPGGSTIGTNYSSFTLHSWGPVTVTNLGVVDPTGSTDLVVTNANCPAGQFSSYSFTVPPNTLALEVFLTNTTGSPNMTLRPDGWFPGGADGYGEDGGLGYNWNSSTLINIASPIATNYTLMVQAEQAGGNAGFTVHVHAIGPTAVPFDGGLVSVTNQGNNVWQYFTVTVPPDALGWDIRLTNVTSGNPQMYICYEAPPPGPGYGWNPSYNASWPSNYDWTIGYDWTGYYYNPTNPYTADNYAISYGQVFADGMGDPLTPGKYYVGVYNYTGPSNLTYSVWSRGIGGSYSIPVTPLVFSNGVANLTGLNPRQAAYYSMTVPTNATSWQVEVDTNVGQSILLIQKGFLPDSSSYNNPAWDLSGGRVMAKTGDQQYLMMPYTSSNPSNIVGGTYYLAVVSDGQYPSGSVIGTNYSSFTLHSWGPVTVTNLGVVDPTGSTDLVVTNANCPAGQFSSYSFTVPPNTLALEVFLTNTTGSPNMTLRPDGWFPGGADGYGEDGGLGYNWNSSTLINIASPIATNYTLMVQAEQAGGNAGFTVRVHAIGPTAVPFDGGLVSVTNQANNVWQYFTVTVPPDALGWDIRLTNVTSGNPQMYICYEAPPPGPGYGWDPSYNTSWPSNYDWTVGYDWTDYYYNPTNPYTANNYAYSYGQVFADGMGNPLTPGKYYVGVYNYTGPSNLTYSVWSRGIGGSYSIPVTPLAFSNGTAIFTGLNPRQAAYYSVVVPTNMPSWQLQVSNIIGQSMVVVQKGALPDSNPYNNPAWDISGGRVMQIPGNQQYLELPPNGATNIYAGTYYLAVVSEGQNPANNVIGSNFCNFAVISFGQAVVTNLGPTTPADIYVTNALQGGENGLYNFSIPNGPAAVEIRLDNVTGGPYMTLLAGSNQPTPYYGYGNDGGAGYSWSSPSIITLPNPAVTNYALTVQASAYVSSTYLNADYTLHIREMPTPTLVFDPSLNTVTTSNVATGTLLNGQSAYYQVTVPATLNGQPVIGWNLNITETTGTPSIRVRPGLLPDSLSGYDGTSPWSTSQATIVPPYLTPGVWYVEVNGSGITSYTLTSSALQLKRPAWTMQSVAGSVTTPGLPPAGPLFADTGVDTNGNPLAGDQGSDLAEGAFDYYAIIVPANNSGVLRTRLDAISGNPNLYIRAGGAPTLSHYYYGGYGSVVYDRTLNASGGSEYGNWVPFNGRYEAALTNGIWYLAVQAAGGSNVRYRLRMDTGNITNLVLNGGGATNQQMVAGDYLYYAVQIPTNSPVDWNITYSVQLGNVVGYIRDRVPPGQGSTVTDYRDWNYDDKNEGPYPQFTSPGTYTEMSPPLRPGNTYYVGFRAVADSTFSISWNTNGGYINYTNVIPFYAGYTNTVIPAHGTMQYRIDVPGTADRFNLTATNAAGVWLYLEQGAPPTLTGYDNWYSSGYANPSLTEFLQTPYTWPWQPGYSYFLAVTNTTATSQGVTVIINGEGPASGPFGITGVHHHANGNTELDEQVVPNLTYQLQTITNLVNATNWTIITTFTPLSTPYTNVDTSVPVAPYRFYRLIEQ